jgi:hypothetical protein
MMPSSTPIRWVIACAAGLLLAACDGGPPADAPAATGAAVKESKSKAAAIPPEMVAAVSSAKNAAVVGLHFQLKGQPTAGKALPVDIALVPHVPMAYLSARFQARDGLSVATGDSLERRADPPADKVINHQLVLLPAAEGVFMVTAIVETEGEDGTVSRVFSIPVIVGPAAAEAPTPAADPAAAPSTPPGAAAPSG